MFNEIEKRERGELSERVKKMIEEFLIVALCSMKNRIAEIEGEIERLSFGGGTSEKDLETALKIQKGLIQDGLNCLKQKGEEMGVMLN